MTRAKNNTIHEFKCSIYPRRLWITYNATPAALNDMFPEGQSDGTPFTKMDDTCDACVVTCRRFKPDIKGGVLIRFESKKAMTLPVIAHEIGHATMEILKYCDCRVNMDDQEPFCYLQQWIADCCEQVKTGKYKD